MYCSWEKKLAYSDQLWDEGKLSLLDQLYTKRLVNTETI